MKDNNNNNNKFKMKYKNKKIYNKIKFIKVFQLPIKNK